MPGTLPGQPSPAHAWGTEGVSGAHLPSPALLQKEACASCGHGWRTRRRRAARYGASRGRGAHAAGPSPQDAGSWRFSPSRQAVLGPFGELLTEAELQQLERAAESLRLRRRRRGEAYRGELRRLARELRALLPAPLLSITVRSPPPAPGQPLPLWGGRLAGAVSSLAALLAHACLLYTSDAADE